MPRTARDLRTLERAIKSLRQQFLPKAFDPTNTYKNGRVVQARTRAFLVLAHAEFESYIEDWARELVTKAYAVWKKTGRVVAPLDSLLASHSERLVVPKKFSTNPSKGTPQQFAKLLGQAVADYFEEVNDNHGIKESNLAGLLGRLGADASAFGTTLLPALTTYGERRGTHSHNSATKAAVALVLDPQDESSRAANMIAELAPLHKWFVDTRRKIK